MNKAAVIGDPIDHSLSPYIHQYWLNQYGLCGEYQRIHLLSDDLPAFFDDFKKHGLNGTNVTIPHKIAVMDYCQQLSDAAKIIGAVNTITLCDDGTLHGDNSDYFGFMEYLRHSPYYASLSKNKVIILGAGGAARGLIYGVIKDNFKQIIIINRTINKAKELQRDLSDFAQHYDSEIIADIWDNDILKQYCADCDLIVNASALGMKKYDIATDFPFPFAQLPPHALCYDIIFNPLETWFLKSARTHGLHCLDGLGMLIYQAIPGFKIWFGYGGDINVSQDMYDYIAGKLA